MATVDIVDRTMFNKYSIDNDAYKFHWIDYCVFSTVFLASAASGLYFGYFRKPSVVPADTSPKNKTSDKEDETSGQLTEYLLGSRRLRPFPVAMSLIGSYVSGVTVLGTPTEIYNFGTQYGLILVPILLMGVGVTTVYLPVFAALKLTSSYEYLELRFNSRVRTFASVLFVLDEVLFLPIVIYVPALAFNQVTGVNVYVVAGVICVLCIFYTIVGGIRAVVFTDAWQVGVMFLGVCVIVAVGMWKVGGLTKILDNADEGGRLVFFNFNPSLYERHTFWAVLIGGTFYWMSFNSVNQTMVQRYMALPDVRLARISLAIYTVGIALFVGVCCFAGLIVYAAFEHCDPLYAGLISRDDQMFPLFVMESVGSLYGLPGLFVAGVFGAALSSLSVVLNSTATVILQDLLKGYFGMRRSARFELMTVKVCTALLGIVSMLLVLVIEQMGGVLAVSTSLSAIAASSSFGVFTLGMLVPRSNSSGALWGLMAGVVMSGTVAIGTQMAGALQWVTPHKLGVWTDDCPVPGSNATFSPVYPDESEVFGLFRLSFHWINPIGVLSGLLVGVVVSYATGPVPLEQVDARLISPVLHGWLPAKCWEPREPAEKAEAAAAMLSTPKKV